MHSDPSDSAPHLTWHLAQRGIDAQSESVNVLELIKAQRERCKTLVEMANASVYFYREFERYDEKAAKKAFVEGSDAVLATLSEAFSNVSTWEAPLLHSMIKEVAEKLELGLGKVAQPLRIAVCGTGVSPSIDITLAILGREKTLSRLQRAITFIQSQTTV
jgi:glutamyl-tRNA synthetase